MKPIGGDERKFGWHQLSSADAAGRIGALPNAQATRGNGSADSTRRRSRLPGRKRLQLPRQLQLRSIPGGKLKQVIWIAVMPRGKDSGVSPDRKTFTKKGAGDWVWTYTPTIVR